MMELLWLAMSFVMAIAAVLAVWLIALGISHLLGAKFK